MPMMHELVVDSVVVRFGEKTVVRGGYITARTGTVTGLLGRNGAGKSRWTTSRSISTEPPLT